MDQQQVIRMLLDEDKVTEASQFQRQRCAAFGGKTASRIRAAKKCQFSLLPHEELTRVASGWYDASAQAMMHGNYGPIDGWTRRQAQLAASQNFDLQDLFVLLRICRTAAIEEEKWSEDIFSVVDEAINEALSAVRGSVSWDIPQGLDYLLFEQRKPEAVASPTPRQPVAAAPQPVEDLSSTWSGSWLADRRDFGRNWLKLPILVRSDDRNFIEELTHSRNVSRSGLYFVTQRSSYKLQMGLKITYPYWTELGAINREYRAKVVRMDALADGFIGIAVEFTESLGPRSSY